MLQVVLTFSPLAYVGLAGQPVSDFVYETDVMHPLQEYSNVSSAGWLHFPGSCRLHLVV
jgi:hypothetical protein